MKRAIGPAIAVILLVGTTPAIAGERVMIDASPVCGESRVSIAIFHSWCEFTIRAMNSMDEIFVGGYAMRGLVAGSSILGDPRYLDTAVHYADQLLDRQNEHGYWSTGYSRHVYLADTGSALGLLMSLHPLVDETRKQLYFDAVSRYVTAIEADSLILPTGAIGVGWRHTEEGRLVPNREPYTISSALTGAQVFVWMFHHTREERYRNVAFGALRWILSTMREDGVIPYILTGDDGTTVGGDESGETRTWESWRYDTSAYVGEGVIAFDKYCARPSWQAEIRRAIAPHIEFLLRSQNDDGTWAVPGSPDQKRSPGVVNLLLWYHEHVSADPRIRDAVCRFERFHQSAVNARAFGMLTARADPTLDNAIVTSIAGRALAELLKPGIDSEWGPPR